MHRAEATQYTTELKTVLDIAKTQTDAFTFIQLVILIDNLTKSQIADKEKIAAAEQIIRENGAAREKITYAQIQLAVAIQNAEETKRQTEEKLKATALTIAASEMRASAAEVQLDRMQHDLTVMKKIVKDAAEFHTRAGIAEQLLASSEEREKALELSLRSERAHSAAVKMAAANKIKDLEKDNAEFRTRAMNAERLLAESETSLKAEKEHATAEEIRKLKDELVKAVDRAKIAEQETIHARIAAGAYSDHYEPFDLPTPSLLQSTEEADNHASDSSRKRERSIDTDEQSTQSTSFKRAYKGQESNLDDRQLEAELKTETIPDSPTGSTSSPLVEKSIFSHPAFNLSPIKTNHISTSGFHHRHPLPTQRDH